MNNTKKTELHNSQFQNHFHKNENSISWKIKFAKVFNQIKQDYQTIFINHYKLIDLDPELQLMTQQNHLATETDTRFQISLLKLALEKQYLTEDEYLKWLFEDKQQQVLKKINPLKIQKLKEMIHDEMNHFSDPHLIEIKRKYQNSPDMCLIHIWDQTHIVALGVSKENIQPDDLKYFIFVYCSLDELHKLKSPLRDPTQHIWKNIQLNHDESTQFARKYFDAYVVLKVNKNLKTTLFKTDPDLDKENLDPHLFEFDLNSWPKDITQKQLQFTEMIELDKIQVKLKDFKFACFSPLHLGEKLVGFLVGFKKTQLSQDDISSLQTLSEKVI